MILIIVTIVIVLVNDIEFVIVIIIFTIFLTSYSVKAESRQISLFGITAHGIEASKSSIRDMRNKITSDGFLALNPQLNLTYIKDDGSFKNFTALIDCYARPAIFIGSGKQYLVKPDLTLGYVLGVYFRMFPPRDQTKLFKVGNYQIIPTPALSLQYRINDRFFLRFQSNYVINFTDIAWEF